MHQSGANIVTRGGIIFLCIVSMWRSVTRYVATHYQRVINSIAFYPAVISIAFLILSYGMIAFDFSATGTDLKASWKWLKLQDASTARSISSSIAAGIISLTVFSFTMVMVVLNQAGSNMTNRVLDRLIGNRFQQIVLGIYIGTIVYALFLLSTIRDIDSGVYIASLSTYLLILITVLDIFLFIYFLHHITNSIKVHVIVQRIYRQTRRALERSCSLSREDKVSLCVEPKCIILAKNGGVFEGFQRKRLLQLCEQHECMVELMLQPGTFVIPDTPILKVDKELPDEVVSQFRAEVVVLDSDDINENYFYGCQQLTEIAVRALSPGINDPGSAIISLRSLVLLYRYRATHFPPHVLCDEKHEPRILLKAISFREVFERTFAPIWDYGKNDRIFRREAHFLLHQLEQCVGATGMEHYLKGFVMKEKVFE